MVFLQDSAQREASVDELIFTHKLSQCLYLLHLIDFEFIDWVIGVDIRAFPNMEAESMILNGHLQKTSMLVKLEFAIQISLLDWENWLSGDLTHGDKLALIHLHEGVKVKFSGVCVMSKLLRLIDINFDEPGKLLVNPSLD